MDVYKTAAMLAENERWRLRSVVTAQLKAVNDRQMTSEVVSSTVQLDDTKPLLTGEFSLFKYSEE